MSDLTQAGCLFADSAILEVHRPPAPYGYVFKSYFLVVILKIFVPLQLKYLIHFT